MNDRKIIMQQNIFHVESVADTVIYILLTRESSSKSNKFDFEFGIEQLVCLERRCEWDGVCLICKSVVQIRITISLYSSMFSDVCRYISVLCKPLNDFDSFFSSLEL